MSSDTAETVESHRPFASKSPLSSLSQEAKNGSAEHNLPQESNGYGYDL